MTHNINSRLPLVLGHGSRESSEFGRSIHLEGYTPAEDSTVYLLIGSPIHKKVELEDMTFAVTADMTKLAVSNIKLQILETGEDYQKKSRIFYGCVLPGVN